MLTHVIDPTQPEPNSTIVLKNYNTGSSKLVNLELSRVQKCSAGTTEMNFILPKFWVTAAC